MTLRRPPALLPAYLRAVLPRRYAGEDAPMPGRSLVLRDVAAKPRRVARYAEVCGFPADAARRALPATYPHLIAFPAALALMTRRDFPFPVLGLVHLADVVEQRRPLALDERLTYQVRVGDPSPHPRGVVFPVEATATAGPGAGEEVWRSVSTYLRRDRDNDRAAAARRPQPCAGPPELAGGADHAPWSVPATVGRRYAAVSGDRNPIHLHPLTARLFGYRRPIAHGMWSFARCVAALAGDGALPEAFTAAVSFHRPIRLPARVVLRTADGPLGQEFALLPGAAERDGRTREHLRGRVAAL